ncbi:Hpt domain-containing protein [Thalassoroseus pseudoceratinae]|uniref:Hpt domain-containing protein n=1 Tax=Thalassoroseus pseudoceratinae TaxID=2713176 RepID=UPI00141E5E82|nr:Hpt domain-containing protein [Thalassoroseus pseudoceratinae]
MSSENSSSNTNQALVFQRDDALDRAGDDLEIAQTVARMFLEHAPDWLRHLRQAITDSDWRNAQRMAHTIKSSGDNLGCHEVRQAAWSIESTIDASEQDALEPMIASLEHAIARCQPVLTEFSQSGKS